MRKKEEEEEGKERISFIDRRAWSFFFCKNFKIMLLEKAVITVSSVYVYTQLFFVYSNSFKCSTTTTKVQSRVAGAIYAIEPRFNSKAHNLSTYIFFTFLSLINIIFHFAFGRTGVSR